ncbi:MAG: N-acetylglucosamine-6-phosphate deacetylase [Firmicutes bacterium HGW-Firmicutes-7]|nr:MAG: N-acetylglucosamine-6-phosphate deacetylase [Firmicutes bacterium HGW-Firmicutes-7]
MKAIINGVIYKDHQLLKDKILLYDTKIKAVIDHTKAVISDYDEIIDAKGLFVLPGFIDVHIHGYGSFDTMDDSQLSLSKISEGIIKNGVTSFLPTTMTMSEEHIHKALRRLRHMKTQCHKGARILGAHIEGPFISKDYKGAQNDEYITTPNADLLMEYEDVIKVITIAPEMDHAMSFIEKMAMKGVTVSIGHTGAEYETVLNAYDHGAKGITHIFSAMTGLHHRKPGCVGAALLQDFYCEIIADNIHMNPAMYDLLIKIKKEEHLLLVTDCMRAGGMLDGQYDLGGQKVTVQDGKCVLGDGTLAGSTLKLNRGLRNFIHQTSIDFEKAVRFVTENPAKYINSFEYIGSLDHGKFADIVIVNEQVDVFYTIKEGEVLYEKKD